MIIRGNTIKYSSMKKKEMIKEETKLEQEINLIEGEINNNFFKFRLRINLNISPKTRKISGN